MFLCFDPGGMSDAIPYETTLTMQSYVQMRDATELDFLDVFHPSTRLESELGWDMEIRNLKGLVFQYKRPKLSKGGVRRFSVRYSKQDPPRQLDTVKNYAKKYGEDIAYYALPLVTEHEELGETLDRTAFVKALAIPDHATVIHIPQGYCRDGRCRQRSSLDVHCSYPFNTNQSWTESIGPSDVLGWKDLYENIEECESGFKIRYNGESWRGDYHDDHQYFPHSDEVQREDYTLEELFGLTKEAGPIISRFGTNDDDTFS